VYRKRAMVSCHSNRLFNCMYHLSTTAFVSYLFNSAFYTSHLHHRPQKSRRDDCTKKFERMLNQDYNLVIHQHLGFRELCSMTRMIGGIDHLMDDSLGRGLASGGVGIFIINMMKGGELKGWNQVQRTFACIKTIGLVIAKGTITSPGADTRDKIGEIKSKR